MGASSDSGQSSDSDSSNYGAHHGNDKYDDKQRCKHWPCLGPLTDSKNHNNHALVDDAESDSYSDDDSSVDYAHHGYDKHDDYKKKWNDNKDSWKNKWDNNKDAWKNNWNNNKDKND